jgi:SAM-dependent methyltransferase
MSLAVDGLLAQMPVVDAGVKEIITTKWQRQQYEAQNQKFGLKVPELGKADDWLPSPHGLTLGEVISSNPKIAELVRGKRVLELGAGVGNHTVLLARYQPACLTVTEITEARLQTTRDAMRANDLDGPCMRYVVADWLHVPLETDPETGEPLKFDLIVSNPPFLCSGQRNRRYFLDELILNAHRVLKDDGHLLFVQTSLADTRKSLDRMMENQFDAKLVARRRFPWRDYYFADPNFVAYADSVAGACDEVGGLRTETICVLLGQLQPFTLSFPSHNPTQFLTTKQMRC